MQSSVKALVRAHFLVHSGLDAVTSHRARGKGVFYKDTNPILVCSTPILEHFDNTPPAKFTQGLGFQHMDFEGTLIFRI